MIKRKTLGQHFLKSVQIAKFIVDSGNLTQNDVIYEIGTGQGILIPFLCEKSKHVITIEKDKSLYKEAVDKFSNIENLTITQGDGFKQNEKFDIFVSNLPYSKSRMAIQWMLMQKFTTGVIMVQYDFAEKLLATKQDRKAISVLAQSGFDMKILRNVAKENFSPQPKINSAVMLFTRKSSFSKELIQTVNLIFSFRRKKIQNIGKQLGLKIKSDLRLEEMNNYEIIQLAKKNRKF
jgi:16S rRNA (adenine1518-N6/adenine1519-N6)-dimethyltransferase|tara:strand:+ start:375 stop:1079 length:705 start_codon:yes stop_codon:yes gene_type:complete